MKKKPPIDGFIPRRSTGSIGVVQPKKKQAQPLRAGLKRRNDQDERTASAAGASGLAQTEHGMSRRAAINRSDIDESLQQIDNHPTATAVSSHKRGGFRTKRHRIVKLVALLLMIVLLSVGGWLGVKAILTSQSVFKGDIFGLIQQKALKQDEKGRTNVLIVGTSEDDPGHPGSNLTDSIMVVSFDQKNKNMYMVSIPRDLEVKFGMACTEGYAGKINQYFSCVDDGDDTTAEDKRQAETRRFIGEILGIDIQYSAHVNYSVMRDVVNAIGSITVTIKGSDGAPGVMDSNFDWKCKAGNANASIATMKKNCPPNGHFIDYPNGPATLDAEHALYLAQARGDSEPTYGLGNSNFDREQNQQKIIMAIREKALSSGTLGNPIKVTALMDAIGNNLKTNFETSEIRTLTSLAKDIPSGSIQSVNLLDDQIMNASGQPVAGAYNYSQLRAYIQKKLYATGITKEDAHVVVLNASGVAGAAQREADALTALGMTVDEVNNAPSGYTVNTIYQLNPNKKQSLTVTKLTQMYGTSVKTSSELPVTVSDTTDFIIIVASSATSVDETDTTN